MSPRDLTGPAIERTARADAACEYFATVEFTEPTPLTLRWSDRYREKFGQQWEPVVLSFGAIDLALNTTDVEGPPVTATLTLSQLEPVAGRARVSDLIRTPGNPTGYEWLAAKVTIRQAFADLDTGHEVTLHEFYIEDQPEITEDQVVLRLIDRPGLIEERSKLVTITSDAFPRADPDAFGVIIPVTIGVVDNAPTWFIEAGGVTTLVVPITATSPGVGGELRVSDVSRFASSGTIQVDDEKIDYSSRLTTPDTHPLPNEGRLKVVKRGAKGTTAAPHAAGANLWELLTRYRAVQSMNLGARKMAPGSITKVMVHGALQPQAVPFYDEEIPPGSGQRFNGIDFPALPILKRQVALAIEDGITVSDTIAVSSPSVTSVTVAAENRGRRSFTNPTTPLFHSYEVLTEVNFPDPSGTVDFATYAGSVVIGGFISARKYTLYANGEIIAQGAAPPSLLGSPASAAFTYSLPGPIKAVKARLIYETNVQPTAAYLEIHATATAVGPILINKTGAASRAGAVTLTGNSTADVVIGGEVTCDVRGIVDDGSGTITGTPGALVRLPGDVAKLLTLDVYPFTEVGDFGASFAPTRAYHLAGGYGFDFLLTDRSFAVVRQKLGEQARAALTFEGSAWEYRAYKFQGPTSTMSAIEFSVNAASDLTTEAGRLKITTLGFTASAAVAGVADHVFEWGRDTVAGETARVGRTARTTVRNALRVYCRLDYRQSGALRERYRIVREVLTPGLPAAQRIWYDLELDWIRDAATALTVANVWLRQWQRQRFTATVTVVWNGLAVELLDLVGLAEHPLLAAHGDLVFRVVRRAYQLDADARGSIELELVEANP